MQMLRYCQSCLPCDIKRTASHVFPRLPRASHLLSVPPPPAARMASTPWISDHGTSCVMLTRCPHPFGILLNSRSETLCDLTLSCLSNLPSLSHTSEKLFSQPIFLIYMENITHLITMPTCNVNCSLTLQVNFFSSDRLMLTWPPTILVHAFV